MLSPFLPKASWAEGGRWKRVKGDAEKAKAKAKGNFYIHDYGTFYGVGIAEG